MYSLTRRLDPNLKRGGDPAFTDLLEGARPVIDQPRVSRGITLGRNVWLGTGAKVMDGVAIGSDVVVGANAVVLEDLPDGAVAVGVPARVVRRRETAEPHTAS